MLGKIFSLLVHGLVFRCVAIKTRVDASFWIHSNVPCRIIAGTAQLMPITDRKCSLIQYSVLGDPNKISGAYLAASAAPVSPWVQSAAKRFELACRQLFRPRQ